MKIKITSNNKWRGILTSKYLTSVRSLLIGGALLSIQPAYSQTGEEIFKSTCAACHTVGGGRLVGPDLQGVTTKRSEDWLLKFIKSSQTLVNSGDADANAIFNEFNKMVMPDQALDDSQIKSLLAYITEKGGAAPAGNTAVAAAPAEKPKKKSNLSPEQMIEKGKLLFEGSIGFENGGAACISCHNVNAKDLIPGGTLAKDITQAFSRLGGAPGLNAILSAPPFPAMTQAYKDKLLSPEEIECLTAFLEKADKDALYSTPDRADTLLIGGFSIFIGLIILIFLLWANRKKRTVKHAIYERQIKASN